MLDRRIGGRGRGLTWTHLDSLGPTWTHLISLGSLGLTWSHLDSFDFTWIHLISPGPPWGPWSHLSQGKGNTWSPKGKGKTYREQKGKGKRDRDDFWDPFWPYIQLRAHARTKRNDFPVGLSPPTSDMCMYASFSFSLHTYVQPGSVSPSAQESLNHPSPIDPKV